MKKKAYIIFNNDCAEFACLSEKKAIEKLGELKYAHYNKIKYSLQNEDTLKEYNEKYYWHLHIIGLEE